MPATLYAAPYASDGGMLYYRKDLVSTPPKTWDELIADCAQSARPRVLPATPVSSPTTRV